MAMKVFLVVRWPVGGIRTFINYVYSKWDEPNIELHILTPNSPEVSVLKEQLKELNCVWYATAEVAPSFKQFATCAYAIVRKNKFDLIHAHGFTSGLSVAWMLPFMSASSIFTSHDVLNKSQFEGWVGKLKKVFVPLLLNRFSVIHSVSHDADLNMKEMFSYINQKKCIVISNGVDTERFYKAKPINLKKQFKIKDDVRLIGFFGRFMSQKGFKYLVEAMVQLETKFPGKYQVVCFGNDGFVREEIASLEKRQLKHLFNFHDLVPDTAPYMKGCDLVAMPSLWEACPLQPMEVLTAGIPIVASRCIGLKEVCKDTPAIMVEPASAESLAEGILKVEHLSGNEFVDFSLEAKKRFNIERVRKSFQTLYLDLMSHDTK